MTTARYYVDSTGEIACDPPHFFKPIQAVDYARQCARELRALRRKLDASLGTGGVYDNSDRARDDKLRGLIDVAGRERSDHSQTKTELDNTRTLANGLADELQRARKAVREHTTLSYWLKIDPALRREVLGEE